MNPITYLTGAFVAMATFTSATYIPAGNLEAVHERRMCGAVCTAPVSVTPMSFVTTRG